MGRSSRRKPDRLAEKLLHIRTALGLSQNELIGRMGLTGELFQDAISAFERGVREPDLLVLMAYARAAGVIIDALVDDAVDMPAKLPARASYKWSVLSVKKS